MPTVPTAPVVAASAHRGDLYPTSFRRSALDETGGLLREPLLLARRPQTATVLRHLSGTQIRCFQNGYGEPMGSPLASELGVHLNRIRQDE